jgi:hypothetical protein
LAGQELAELVLEVHGLGLAESILAHDLSWHTTWPASQPFSEGQDQVDRTRAIRAANWNITWATLDQWAIGGVIGHAFAVPALLAVQRRTALGFIAEFRAFAHVIHAST